MTLDEINSLDLEDVKREVQNRIFNSKDPIPSHPDPLPEDFNEDEWFDSQFTQEELDAEFLVLKQELTTSENERLRRVDLESRFHGLQDMRVAYYAMYPDQPNYAVFLRDLINQDDHADAESKMVALEAKDVELQNSDEMVDAKFQEARIAEYVKEGATVNGILEAIWEKVVEGDSTKADALQAKRQAVKLRVPKPSK